MESAVSVIELKPNTPERVQEWAEFIDKHRETALASIEAEGVTVESWFSLTLQGRGYLVGYMREESMASAVGKSEMVD